MHAYIPDSFQEFERIACKPFHSPSCFRAAQVPPFACASGVCISHGEVQVLATLNAVEFVLVRAAIHPTRAPWEAVMVRQVLPFFAVSLVDAAMIPQHYCPLVK